MNKPEKPSDKSNLPSKKQGFLTNVMGENPSNKVGNPYAQYLSRSILLEESSPPKNIRAIISLFSVILFGLIVIAAYMPLDERAIAPGQILPINFVQPVQHLEGGIVADVLVKEDDFVDQGQALILLDDTASRAEYESLKARNVALLLQIERLRAFGLERAVNFSGNGALYPELAADQVQILATQKASRAAQTAVIRAQIQENRDQLKGLLVTEEALIQEYSLMQEEVDIQAGLVEKGLVPRLKFLGIQRDLAKLEGDLASARNNMSATRGAITEGFTRVTELRERLKNDAFVELGRISSEQAQVNAQLARLQDRLRRTAVIAPISGRVTGLTVNKPGGIVPAGLMIMEIVPESDEMIAEIRISPRDIGHIPEGAEVLIKVDTYNFARWGGIKGRIESISASSFIDDEGNPYFRGLARLDQNYVGLDPKGNLVTPGMTLVGDIKTGQKTLLEYLIRPIYNTLSDSFGER
jgi:HlyD family secretion protein/adhesin transport system membrane fusion protein